MAVQVADQEYKGWTPLVVIERELGCYELVGAHLAEWYCRPGNEAAFNAVCPEGRLVFLEKYHDADGKLAVVYLFAYEGRVHLSFSALNDDEFGPKFHFAVRCTPSSNNT